MLDITNAQGINRYGLNIECRLYFLSAWAQPKFGKILPAQDLKTDFYSPYQNKIYFFYLSFSDPAKSSSKIYKRID